MTLEKGMAVTAISPTEAVVFTPGRNGTPQQAELHIMSAEVYDDAGMVSAAKSFSVYGFGIAALRDFLNEVMPKTEDGGKANGQK